MGQYVLNKFRTDLSTGAAAIILLTDHLHEQAETMGIAGNERRLYD